MSNINAIKELVFKEAKKLNLEIISVEWVNEFGNKILQVIADSEGGLTIDQSTDLNQAISDKIDDIVADIDEYMIEVSSPGLERELKTDDDILKNINQYVYVELNESVALSPKKKIKELNGYLLGYSNNILEFEYNNKGQIKKLKIEKNNIKLIRLAIKF